MKTSESQKYVSLFYFRSNEIEQVYWSPLPLHLTWCHLFPRARNSIINICQLVFAYRTFYFVYYVS